MASARQALSLLPFDKDQMKCGTCPRVGYDEDVLQLQADVANVVEGRVELSTFSAERQVKIMDYYRYFGNRQCTESYVPAKVTNDTLDVV